MFRNYLQIAFRTLEKNKVYSFINISGFAIGITCTLLILLWVHDELTYNAWMPKYDKVFRLMIKADYDGKVNVWQAVPRPAADAIKEEHASVVNAVVTEWGGDHLLAVADKAERAGIKRKGIHVGESFLDIFQFPMISGEPQSALDDMKSIVLTESTAKALFGDQDAMDKIVRMDDGEELKVTGIMYDMPDNSDLQFDFLTTWKLYQRIQWVKGAQDRWDFYSFPVYVELSNASEQVSVENKIRDMLARHGQNDFKKEFMLHPASRWHLHNQFENGKESGGMIVYVRMFAIVAGLVLFIACVNFMNLATARAEKRAIEVGVRKSIGSKRADLVWQFIIESILTTAIAFAAGLLVAQLLLPFYNQLVSKQLSIPYTSLAFIGSCAATIIFVGLLAGSYPAFYLSAFKPVSVLKGGKSAAGGRSIPRKILVVTQFGFSMVLIMATIVVYQQIQHVRDRDMGYEPDNMLIINITNDVHKNYTAIKDALLNTGVVDGVTKSNGAITEVSSWTSVDWPGKSPDQKYFFSMSATEYDYVKTMGLKLLEGRDFSREFKTDSNAVIVNRAAIDLMGLKDPIGTKVDMPPSMMNRHIIGVVENTISGSPHDIPGPMILCFIPDWVGAVTIRMNDSGTLKDRLAKVEKVFKAYSPAYPFEFRFADEAFQQKFTTINLTSRLASIFATLTFIITGLGLFGLAAFTASQRTKEMGIRKVMGASVRQLVQLVTSDFSMLVVIAFLIASPVAWYLISQYLEQYQYRVDVQWWIFPATGVLALIFALIIVSTQALRAARSNPAQSLRTE